MKEWIALGIIHTLKFIFTFAKEEPFWIDALEVDKAASIQGGIVAAGLLRWPKVSKWKKYREQKTRPEMCKIIRKEYYCKSGLSLLAPCETFEAKPGHNPEP